MANLRVTRIRVSANNAIRVEFSNSLDPLINKSNIDIDPILANLPKPQVLDVKVRDKLLYIQANHLTPFANYTVTFQSSDTQRFKSLNGSEFLLEDGKNNTEVVQGAAQPNNTIKNALIDYLSNNIYNLDGSNFVSKIIDSQSEFLARGLYDIGQAANDNYLEHIVEDERHVRGKGPWDRLNQEGAFEIIRVGLNETDFTKSLSFSFDEFPRDRITLQRTDVNSETLVAGTGAGTFNGFILTVQNKPVTKLSSVTIFYRNGDTAEYSIPTLGYQIKSPVYDTDYASTLLTLDENQFKLSSNIFGSDLIPPVAGDRVVVSYQYKSLGRNVDEDSVVVSEVIATIREVTPPIITEFSLEHAPVVTEQDNIPESGGVSFLNPRACVPFSEAHPAFIREVPYRLEGLPTAPGEYSVDYENGRVFVYGEEINDGTGQFPPVATYNYRKTFVSDLDYTYNPELQEVVANPLRDMVGRATKVSFDYEQVLIPGVDYIGNVHVEELDERVENRLATLTSLQTEHTPITNVFRVYNETTGELYSVNRFSDSTVYFSANNYPRIEDITRERASFSDVVNELMIVDNTLTNTSGIKVYKVNLLNNRIISATEDSIGSVFNSSVSFSRTDIFTTELYYDGQTSTIQQNIDRLTVNDYVIDYENGVIYVGVTASQDLDLGTVNYKKPAITTNNNHIISVSEVYHSLEPNSGVNITLDYTEFTDTEIIPNTFSRSDERFLNGDETLPYQNINGKISVSDNPKNVRGIFDLYDLNNNREPINFADGATVSGNVITLGSNGQNLQQNNVVAAGGTISLPFISPGVTVLSVNSVLRASDGAELWDSSGSISGYTLTLSGAGSPVAGDIVVVNYQVRLNGGATPVVDYNRGEYYVDYSYLADEILVSYEWGDNVIDFRQSTSVDEGTEYFVTYRVGALRSGLLKNFGTLIDLPIMQSFDTSLPRENYRDALQGALQSFTKGPTIPALKLLVKSITKINPEITEAIFDIWNLGISSLYQDAIDYTGDPEIVIGKFDHGVLMENPGQTITFPASSNIRLEEGTMEMFVIPSWDGLDNDATLRFDQLTIDGRAAKSSEIFIGSDSHHPVINSDGYFTVSRFDDKDPSGLPSAVFLPNRGYFIYYDETSKRWNFLAKDGYGDHEYSGRIFTSGEFYDVKYILGLGEASDMMRSLTNDIKFRWNLNNDGYADGYDGYNSGLIPGYSFDGITFMSDDLHYLFDMANPAEIPVGLQGTIQQRHPHPAEIEARRRKSKNRMSIYKDGRGYLNFEVYDKNSSLYKVSADISDWMAGQTHFISTAWKINTFDRRDEIHLFIDGVEVSNILRYGGRPIAAAGDRFRTVKPEIVAGTIAKKIIKGNDLVTTAGGNVVTSPSVDFAAEGIVAGDTIDILEIGFGTFTILGVTGNSLQLDSAAYATFNDARFSVNKFEAIVSDEVDLSANVAISVLSGGVETELPGPRAEFPSYSIDKNSHLQTVLTMYGPADVGDKIYIRTLGMNHRRCRESVYLWGNTQSILKTRMPPPINLDEVKVFAKILPLMSIGPENASVVGGNFVASGIIPSVVSNSTEGRALDVRITGGNVDFSTPVEVQITGTSTGGITETLSFSAPGTQTTTNNWKTIADITVTVKPVVTTSRSIAIEIKETYPITNPDGNNDFPIIRYSYQDNNGTTLSGGTDGIIDDGFFIDKDVGKSLVIESPASVAGTYTITEFFEDGTIKVSPAPAVDFTGGTYKVYNATIGRSGFQNGFFTFEKAGDVGTAYPLPQGRYEFDYSAWLEIPFVNMNDHTGFIGSDFLGRNQARAVIDEFRVLSTKITDVRIGETLATGQKSVTTDAITLRPFRSDSDTLMLVHFDNKPFENEADFYKISNKEFLQSASSVNGDFSQSLVITERPYEVDNNGILSTRSEGSIEFWVSPRFDTINDPVERYYFDASSAVTEEVVSLTNGTVKIAGRTQEVLSVRLQTDTQELGKEFFAGGRVQSDFQTISLGLPLPATQTPVRVTYVPNGFSGDRLSIFKDKYGFLTFKVTASGQDYEVRQPIFWQRDTWHRIFVSYKFNRRDNQDEIRMFVDGRESGTIRFGQGFLFGQGFVFGQGVAGDESTRLVANIDFLDTVSKLFIGSTFRRTNIAAARFDNLKISNVSRSPLICSGVAIDENFQTNIDIVKPVVEDLYTLYLINFDQILGKNDDFSTLRDERFGIFNFIIDVIDSFRIVSDSDKMDQILRELIGALKPAQSKATINIVT